MKSKNEKTFYQNFKVKLKSYKDFYLETEWLRKSVFIFLVLSIIGTGTFLIWYYAASGRYNISTSKTVNDVFENVFLNPSETYCKESSRIPESLEDVCLDIVTKNKVGYMNSGPFYKYNENNNLGYSSTGKNTNLWITYPESNDYKAKETKDEVIFFSDFEWDIFEVSILDYDASTRIYQIEAKNNTLNKTYDYNDDTYYIDYSTVYNPNLVKKGDTNININDIEKGYLSPVFQFVVDDDKLTSFVFYGINGYPLKSTSKGLDSVEGIDGEKFTLMSSKSCQDINDLLKQNPNSKPLPCKEEYFPDNENDIALSYKSPFFN